MIRCVDFFLFFSALESCCCCRRCPPPPSPPSLLLLLPVLLFICQGVKERCALYARLNIRFSSWFHTLKLTVTTIGNISISVNFHMLHLSCRLSLFTAVVRWRRLRRRQRRRRGCRLLCLFILIQPEPDLQSSNCRCRYRRHRHTRFVSTAFELKLNPEKSSVTRAVCCHSAMAATACQYVGFIPMLCVYSFRNSECHV